MAQEIILKRNTNDVSSLSTLPQGEAAAYAKLDALSHKLGQPVVVFFKPEYTKGQGTGNTVAALYAIGTGNGVGMYQAFSTIEDMLAVQSSLSSHISNYNTFKNALLDDSTSHTNSSTALFSKVVVDGQTYIRANFDFYSTGSISFGGIGEGGSGEGALTKVTIKVGETEYESVGGVVTLPAYPTKVSELENDSNYTTKTYVDKAISNARDGRVDTLVDTTIPALQAKNNTQDTAISNAASTASTAKTTATDAQTKVNTLIGSDSGKSVRDISKLAVADLLSGADADFDTLLEIANYLETHSTDAIAMSNAIEALKKITKHFYNNGTVTEDSIKTYIDNAISALKVSDINTAISTLQTAVSTLQGRTITAGKGLTGGGSLAENRTINVVSANDGITVNDDNIQLNTINNLTSDSTTKPLSAAQGKALKSSIDTLGGKKITAGDGLTGDITLSSGGTIAVNVDNTSIKISSDKLTVSVIDGGTF